MIANERLLQIADKLVGGLYPYQSQILRNKNNEIIINKSRQIGISYSIACWALLQSIFNEKNELIISPSLRQSKHMMDYIYQHLNKLRNDFKIELREETKTSLIFTQGGQIHSLPNSANTIRGFQADDVYIDEFAHFTNGTDKEIIEALAPSLSRGGNIRYISTPFGDQNIFYKYWHNRPEQNRILINYRECPDMTKDNLDKLRDILGSDDAWNQEMENMFLSDMEGQEFPTTLIQSCINPNLVYTELLKDREYIAGADIGREHDLTAFLVLEKQENKYILRFKKIMKQTPYDIPEEEGQGQLQFFQSMLNNYHFGNFVIDESGIGNMLAEKLARDHKIERVTFNNENKQQLVSNLKKLMQEKRIELVDDPQLVNSMRAIRRIYTPSNYLRFDSSRDGEIGHADLFWALALAVKENLSGFYFRLG